MADRTISPVDDAFLIWTAVIASLTAQFILTLLGIGAGIISIGYVAAQGQTIGWAAFLWWAATGVFAACMGGMVIGALGEGIDDARKTVLALIAWATAILLVAVVTAFAAGSGASIFATFGGPVAGMLDTAADGKMTDPMRRTLSGVAISSVVALLLGAAASVAGAIYAPETKVKATKRT